MSTYRLFCGRSIPSGGYVTESEVRTYEKILNQDLSKKMSEIKELIIINGHYKGIDQRIRDSIVDDEISIGDYVLTNGELSSLVIIDSIVRLIPGVINDYSSAVNDSFYNDLLDGPHYTRPRKIKNL